MRVVTGTRMIGVYESWYDWSWYYYSSRNSGSALVSVCCSARVGSHDELRRRRSQLVELGRDRMFGEVDRFSLGRDGSFVA